ncbi:MICAL3 isoform 6, partial [Pan troglodytes]
QEELKRLHRAQIIQRQLQQVEERQRRLEERGVAVEKALRGEADYWGESYYSDLIDLHLGGMYGSACADTNPADTLSPPMLPSPCSQKQGEINPITKWQKHRPFSSSKQSSVLISPLPTCAPEEDLSLLLLPGVVFNFL